MAWNANTVGHDAEADFLDLAVLFGIDSPAPAPAPVVPSESGHEEASERGPQVPTSPGLGADDLNCEELCEAIGLESIWGTPACPESFHSEVNGDFAACSRGVRSFSDTEPICALKQELEAAFKQEAEPDFKQEPEPDFRGSVPIPTSLQPQQRRQQRRPVPIPARSKKMIHAGGFKVSAPLNGKPLYVAPANVHEETVQSIFPEWTLRLERSDFNKWKKKNRVRKLAAPESECLRKYRRTMLARVYADRARHRRTAKHVDAEAAVTQLQTENAALRARVAELEALQGC